MQLFSVGENALNSLRTQGIDFLALWRMSHIFGKFDVVLPNMARHHFLTIFAVGTLRAHSAVGANTGVALVHAVTIAVGSGVSQNLILRARLLMSWHFSIIPLVSILALVS